MSKDGSFHTFGHHCPLLLYKLRYLYQQCPFSICSKRCHYLFPMYNMRCSPGNSLFPWTRSDAWVIKEKMKLREDSWSFPSWNLIPMFQNTWSSRSLIVGSCLHLTHEFLNLSYPLMNLNTNLPLMGKRRNNVLFHPNFGLIQPRLVNG